MKIPRKIVSEIVRNGASAVLYSDPKGEKYGFMIYSIRRGQPYKEIIRTRRPCCSSGKRAKEAGESLIEKIILTSYLENSMMYLN